MSLKDKIEKFNCHWLEPYLRDLLRRKDLKNYNRLKFILYYYPDAMQNSSYFDLKKALEYPDETYICITDEPKNRYLVFDKIYEMNVGKPFSSSYDIEAEYVSFEEIFEYFKI